MNISAVLRELGLPTIRGYRPMENIQRAIFPAIDRFLSARPALLLPAPPALAGVVEAPPLWEEPPPVLNFTPRPPGPGAWRGWSAVTLGLVPRVDPVERDFRNRALGHAGEALVVGGERRRLEQADRPDLARRVRWVSQEDGDGAGYDVHSFDPSGADRLLEVKTTCGGSRTPSPPPSRRGRGRGTAKRWRGRPDPQRKGPLRRTPGRLPHPARLRVRPGAAPVQVAAAAW